MTAPVLSVSTNQDHQGEGCVWLKGDGASNVMGEGWGSRALSQWQMFIPDPAPGWLLTDKLV